ncbi:ferric reductase NAD binding domain-containing protein [Xylariomycetidae sp. FL0641]|nr:ferric reductase NAD binding domain-containing protein [Xylariomycetidae sp. FL0641]
MASTNETMTMSAEEAYHLYLVSRQELCERMVARYGISLGALIGVFVMAHWLRQAAVRLGLDRSRSRVLTPLVAVSRTARKLVIRQLPGFPSVGHAIVVSIYVALNAFFSCWKVDFSGYTDIAGRFGWMATGNLAFVVFLALKNTPLAFLTAYSYERLNVLHRIAGYTTLLYAIMHASMYAAYFCLSDKVHVLHEDVVTAGIVLGLSMLLTVAAGVTLRRRHYELFYVVHVVLFVVILVTLGLHRPSFGADRGPIVTVLVAALWGGDRLLRLARLACHAVNNAATISALPGGGTRLVLRKPLLPAPRARPGMHCYVWLPGVRAAETHPFTIVAADPLELVVAARGAFTRDLHRHARRHPGARLRVAAADGPYGTLPDPLDFDRVVLVAGGAGATFTFGLAADMLRRMQPASEQQIDFVWAVKGHDNLAWFAQHLRALRAHAHAPKVSLRIHVTRAASSSAASATAVEATAGSEWCTSGDEVTPSEKTTDDDDLPSPRGDDDHDPEKDGGGGAVQQETEVAVFEDLPLLPGRPDPERLVREAVDAAAGGRDRRRVLVACCGPHGLVDAVRAAAAAAIRVDGPAVELHCEQFGW